MARGGSDTPNMAFAGCCCFTFFVSCFLLGFSFDTLAPNRMSFVYDANIQKHEYDRLYNQEDGQGGRFFLGLGRTFRFPFPRDVQRILFSAESGADSDFIIAKDSEGIDISISCSLQYTVNRNRGELKALFERFGSLQDALTDTPEIADKWGWTPFFISYTRATVRDVMSRYNATSLWKDRASLSRDMRSALTEKLGEHHVQVRGFQLLNMDIPAELQNSIISTTVEAEAVLRARENLRAINATVVTDVAVQSRLAEIDLLVAQAAAAEVEAGAQARNESLVLSIAAQVEAVSSLKQSMGLNSTDYLALLYMDTLQAAGAGSVSVGIASPEEASVPPS